MSVDPLILSGADSQTGSMSPGTVANLRRLYLHILSGGTLNATDLARTGGAATPEALSELIAAAERESDHSLAVSGGPSTFP